MRGSTSPPLQHQTATQCRAAVCALLAAVVSSCHRDPFAGVPERIDHLWIESLLGKSVTLPPADFRGIPIPASKARYIVSINCGSCTDFANTLDWIKSARELPVVLVAESPSEQLLSALGSSSRLALIVSPNQSRCAVPPEMIALAPQAVLVDGAGRIIRVPTPSESLRTFVSAQPGAARQ